MRRLIRAATLLLLPFIGLLQCTEEQSDIDLSTVKTETELKRFDLAFFQSDSTNMPAEIDRLQQDFPEFFSAGTNLKFWKAQRTDPKQIDLYQKIQKVFTDSNALEENLNFSMKHYYYHFPKAEKLKFYGYVSNLDFDYPILFADSINFIAMDMYLGPQQPFYNSLPKYLAFYRQPTFMIRDAIAAVVEREVVRDPKKQTLLDDMVYHGRKLYILKKLMPQKEETVILKYTPKQLAFSEENERSIWSYFIEHQHLFDTSTDLKRRFIEVAPFSKFRTEFDNETPGMIGRWLGLQIVEAYMEARPEVSLPQLAQETDARMILKESGYKP